MLKSIVLKALRAYKKLISPYIPHACRFEPTCSEYMMQAIVAHGVVKGVFYGIKRLLRCHPWGGNGYDPVPTNGNTNHHKDTN